MDSDKDIRRKSFRVTKQEDVYWSKRIAEERKKGREVSLSSICRAALRKALGTPTK